MCKSQAVAAGSVSKAHLGGRVRDEVERSPERMQACYLFEFLRGGCKSHTSVYINFHENVYVYMFIHVR